ncbi:MAG: NAD(P)-binding domain-containing protein, partial [Chloroflexota bacterium]
IIGAGPAGLAAIHSFNLAGLAFDAVEAHQDVGGLWNMDNPGSPIYKSAHFVSSKQQSCFIDFPMPDHYPDYPRWDQVRDYIHAWADKHELRQHIEFNQRVVEAKPADDAGESWLVTFEGGEVRRYQGIVACPGFQRIPNLPEFPGHFSGECYHSQQYQSRKQFEGKRILVVGGGNSGVDIACDAAIAAESAAISLRRDYWFIPKHIRGIPFDWYDVSRSDQTTLAAWLTDYLGDAARFGLPVPDHLPLTHHPITNDQIIHYLTHGDLLLKPAIERLEGQTVHFTDGSHLEVGVIIFATGYQDRIAFIDEQHLRIEPFNSDLFLWIFHKRYPNFLMLGVGNLTTSGYYGFNGTADLAANYVKIQQTYPDRYRIFRNTIEQKRPDLSRGFTYVQSAHHLEYVNAVALDRYMTRLMVRLKMKLYSFPRGAVPPSAQRIPVPRLNAAVTET